MRDGDFSQSTKNILAKRAGFECSVPHCKVRTIGPGASPDQTASVGQASHIYSAGKNGPRGHGGLTHEQLSHHDNGIWTCELHGTVIDNNQGQAFPAGLLRSWKEWHEKRIANASTGAPMDRRINEILLIRSPLFAPKSIIKLGRVTVVSSTHSGAGRTALCQWLSGIRNRRDLHRWIGGCARRALNVQVSYSDQSERVLAMDVEINSQPRFSLDGIQQPEAPTGIDFVYLKERYLDRRAGDDLTSMARLFGVDVETVRALAEQVGAQGNNRFRELKFEPATADEDAPPESILHEDGTAKMNLFVETYDPSERFPLEFMSASVETEVLLAMAIELAKCRSKQQPTLLIIEGKFWNFMHELFEQIANAIDDCARQCQVLLIEPNFPLDKAQMLKREWLLYNIDRPPSQKNQPRLPANIVNR